LGPLVTNYIIHFIWKYVFSWPAILWSEPIKMPSKNVPLVAKIITSGSWKEQRKSKLSYLLFSSSRVSSVDIVTGYRLNGQHSIPSSAIFSKSPYHQDWFWGPPSLRWNGYRGTFSLGKAARACSWPCLSSSEAQNGGAVPLLPHTHACHSAYQIKHRDNFMNTPPVQVS
jgi:hypothetical protein